MMSVGSSILEFSPTEDTKLDFDYLKGPYGITKVIQLVFGTILIIFGKSIWLLIPVYIIFLLTLAWLWLYFLKVPSKYGTLQDWTCLEFIYTFFAASFYGLTTMLAFLTLNITFGILGIQTTLAYIAGTYFLVPVYERLDSYVLLV